MIARLSAIFALALVAIVSMGQSFTGLPRIILSSALSLYVNGSSGNDSNLCRATGASACLTIQGAINKLKAGYDLGGQAVTINVAAGTYTAANIIAGPWVGATPTGSVIAQGKCAVTISGDTTTPTNVLVQTGDGNSVFTVSDGGHLCVQGMQVKSTGGGHLLDAIRTGTIIATGKMDYNSTTGDQILARRNSYFEATADYTISAGAAAHWQSNNNSNVIVQVRTITLTGTPAFAQQFAGAIAISNVVVNGNTYSGSATGSRFASSGSSFINTSTGGTLTTLPGNAAGATSLGGQYQ